VRGLADPALVEGAVVAQLADDVPLTTRSEVRLDAFTLENRTPADVAGDVLVLRPELLGHGTPILASGPPPFWGVQEQRQTQTQDADAIRDARLVSDINYLKVMFSNLAKMIKITLFIYLQ